MAKLLPRSKGFIFSCAPINPLSRLLAEIEIQGVKWIWRIFFLWSQCKNRGRFALWDWWANRVRIGVGVYLPQHLLPDMILTCLKLSIPECSALALFWFNINSGRGIKGYFCIYKIKLISLSHVWYNVSRNMTHIAFLWIRMSGTGRKFTVCLSYKFAFRTCWKKARRTMWSWMAVYSARLYQDLDFCFRSFYIWLKKPVEAMD